MNNNLKCEPFLLIPAGKDYLWGGSRLKERYNKDLDMSPLAETWECSTHPDGLSIIASGQNRGRTLAKVLSESPGWIGAQPNRNGTLPILIKYIDAKSDLSVQVHPDDKYALKHEKQLGKTEMWYVVEAKPGAKLVYGFKDDITADKLRECIKDQTLMEHLNTVPVKSGDFFFIEPGTVHAIGAGALIAEIQQNSNVTYRLYDYGRKDKNSSLRPLHIDKAVQVINYQKCESLIQPKSPGTGRQLLCSCKYFKVEHLIIGGSVDFEVDKRSFAVFMLLDGAVNLSCCGPELEMIKGNTAFVPAASGKLTLRGNGDMLLVQC